MTTRGFDGFDHYNALADLEARSNFIQWQKTVWGGGFTFNVSFVTGLTGYGKALSLTTAIIGGPTANISTLREVFGSRNQEFYVGYRLKGVGTGAWLIFGDSIGSGSYVTQFSVHVDEGNYALEVWSGNGIISTGTLLYATANNVWPGDVGFFLEIHVKIATSGAGTIEFKVDNVLVGSASITTQRSVNAWSDVIDIAASPVTSNSETILIDDAYYNDTTTGPGMFPMNSWAGDSRVASQFATGNDVVQFTPFANTNWQEISEVAMDSDVSYNFDNTAGDQDTFTFNPLVNTLSSIYALQLTYATRNDGAGTRTIAGVVKIAGTSYVYGSPNNVPASATYVYFSDIWYLSPATGLNFTRTEVNAADFGYKLVT